MMKLSRALLIKIKKTGPGCAAAWLLRPVKHRRDIRRQLQARLPYPPTPQQIRWCFCDYCRFCLRYRGDLDTDYFGAQLYRKSDLVRRESLAHSVRFGWRDALQARSCWEIFRDKREFYRAFDAQLHRPWMIADGNTPAQAVEAFAAACGGRVFSKIPKGQGGKGITLWDLNDRAQLSLLLKQCQASPLLLEGVLEQSEDLYAFSQGAVNTLRLISLVDESGRPHVARCELRMGRRGMAVDNYSSGGLVAQVDVDSGVIFTTGRDENGHEYIFHPDTEKQIVGFQIPDWEGYKAFVLSLAARFPEMRYVGWDIIKDSAGNFCVIEGNKDAGVGGLEGSLLYGLKPGFDALLSSKEGMQP